MSPESMRMPFGALAHRLEHLVKDLDRIGHAVAQHIVVVSTSSTQASGYNSAYF